MWWNKITAIFHYYKKHTVLSQKRGFLNMNFAVVIKLFMYIAVECRPTVSINLRSQGFFYALLLTGNWSEQVQYTWTRDLMVQPMWKMFIFPLKLVTILCMCLQLPTKYWLLLLVSLLNAEKLVTGRSWASSIWALPQIPASNSAILFLDNQDFHNLQFFSDNFEYSMQIL